MVHINAAKMLVLDGIDPNAQKEKWLMTPPSSFHIQDSDTCWWRSQNLTIWKNNVFVSTSALSANYGLFAKWAYRYAEMIIEHRTSKGGTVATEIPEQVKKYVLKLQAALLAVVPDRVRTKALRTDDSNTVDILVDLISNVNPGIKAELESLREFTMRPGVATTPSDAEEKLVSW